MITTQSTCEDTKEMLENANDGTLSPALYEERKRRIKSMIEYRTTDVTVHKKSIYDSAASTGSILIKSSGWSAGSSFLKSDDQNKVHLGLTRGISLIGITDTSKARKLLQVDPCADKNQVTTSEPFRQVIDQYTRAFPVFAIIVHDSPFCGLVDLSPIFQGLPLKKWANLQFRQPYIGIIPSKKGKSYEMLGDKESSIVLKLSNFSLIDDASKPRSKNDKIELKKSMPLLWSLLADYPVRCQGAQRRRPNRITRQGRVSADNCHCTNCHCTIGA